MSTASFTQETLDLMKAAQPGDLIKAWTQPTGPTTGVQNYDLQKPALSLFPVLTPLRNKIARVSAAGGVQANWRAITGINVNGMEIGVSEGNRGGVTTTSTADYYAAYRGIGLEDYVTEEARYSAEQYMDILARAQTNLLWATMIAEEAVMLAGQGTYGLGQPNAPSVADVGTGGALAPNTTYSVIVAPLTLAGLMNGSVAKGVRGQVSRTNADGTTDQYGGGTGKLSANATVLTANDGHNTHSISSTVAPVVGALGYAWFWGAAGAEVLGAITTVNSVVITAAAAGTQTAASLGANDNSANNLIYDGLLAQIFKPGSNAYLYQMPTGLAGTGTGLTADGDGGIVEIDAALQHFWDNYRLSPSTIWVSSQEQTNITKKVLQGNSNGAQRFMLNVEQGNVKGGELVTAYLNKYGLNGARALPVKNHPNLPPGTIFFDTDSLPYPLNGVDNVVQMRMRQDYYATMWPMTKRRREFGTYADGVLQNYFPPAFGAITNIANA